MTSVVHDSPQQLAEVLGVSRQTVYRWIRQGKLQAKREAGRLVVSPTVPNNDFILARIRNRYRRFTLRVPRPIQDYHKWHKTLDDLVWLLKVSYADRVDLAKHHFRLEKLFVSYIGNPTTVLSVVRRTMDPPPEVNIDLVADDLKRGWYNELAYCFPLKESTLGLSARDIFINQAASAIRFAFPSWRIVAAYYSAYFYFRAITLLKVPSFRLEQHDATLNTFNNSVADSLAQSILKFPFNLAYVPGRRINRRALPLSTLGYLKYRYARHPRYPQVALMTLVDKVYGLYTRNGHSTSRPRRYSLLDFLRDFRVWANYLDVDDLAHLYGPGFRGYLDQNLSTLLFFIGGMAEMCAIALLTPQLYIKALQELYNLLSSTANDVHAQFENTPLYQRSQIYHRLGMSPAPLLLSRPPQMNALQLP